MQREIKFRAWDAGDSQGEGLASIMYFFDLTENNRWILEKKCPIMQFTGLKDNSSEHADIYEGDIINDVGNVIGNIYESPQIQQEGTDHTIASMGTNTWRESESIAMGRGCKYAK